MKIEDLRGDTIKRTANAHVDALDTIVERHHNSAVHRTIGNVGIVVRNVVQTALGGYIAGYAITGDTQAAVQWSEIATTYWVTAQIGIGIPLRLLGRNELRSAREKVNREQRTAHRLAEEDQLHQYTPEEGVDFAHHEKNPLNKRAESLKERYVQNLAAYTNPITRTIRNVAINALGMWFVSSIVDGETNVIDLFGVNPIERAMDAVHYLGTQVSVSAPYLDATHAHLTDLSQSQMLKIGVGAGLVVTARQYLMGAWQTLRARMRE